MLELISIILIGFVLDLFLGDPPYRYHPVRLIGRCISSIENVLRKAGWEGKLGGSLLALSTTIIVLFVYISGEILLAFFHPGVSLLFDLYLVYSCLAFGDLLTHMKPIVSSLEMGDLVRTRREVSKVVGRNTDLLDEPGLGRATVETMAENFVDGFLSPLFWYVAGGLISCLFNAPIAKFALSFMLVFKVASTLDSMVGYRDQTYFRFGWAGARMDDLLNFIPARISLFVLFLGAWVVRLNAVAGARIALRDRRKHDSPNAAHAESFVAGALDIRLGGPTTYSSGLKNKPWLGDGSPVVGIQHIRQTASLLKCSAWISIFTLLSPFFFIIYVKTF